MAAPESVKQLIEMQVAADLQINLLVCEPCEPPKDETALMEGSQ